MPARPALLIALVLLGASSAMGAPKQAPSAEPRPSAEALRLARAVRENRAQAAGAEAQIAHLRGQLVQLAAVEASGERGAGDKRSRLDQLNARETELTARLGRAQNQTGRLLGVLALYRRDPPPALLVHPASARDAVRAQILARALAPELARRGRALAKDLSDLQVLRRQVDAASEDLFSTESNLADQRARLETLIADKQALERALVADADTAEAALRVLAAKSGAPADLLERLPRDVSDLGPAPEKLVEPVQGQLVGRFGQQTDKGRLEGFSWKVAPGAPVLAPASGVIEYAGPLNGYGLILILRTGGAYHLVLTGLKTTSAVTGRSVAAGEPIGRMADDAGPSPELYLEVRRSGEPVDPARWFKTAAR
jgi:septal ring factor EnvC (AmiA/AmiB activator)